MNTTELIASLRGRYAEPEAPKCHICGAEMTIQSASSIRITYGCTGATYDDSGCHYAPGRNIADDHYADSRVTVANRADPDVLALVEALESAQRGEQQWKAAVEAFCADDAEWHKLTTSNNKLISTLATALSKQADRIAELEARTVTVQLPAHKYRECVNGLLEEAIAYAGTQQLRERLSSRLANFVQPDHPHTRCAVGIKCEVKGE
ncbi:ead/Ea22-like family protein [Atlantibacter hermannii]|uniref:ead/Ea22-like family protein n=1 Tax=Atlantibacter hermannii TaxID=565 RepID=UPI0028977225|nr:ead/Ea22-like family protein [Atlantibacter hermannii]